MSDSLKRDGMLTPEQVLERNSALERTVSGVPSDLEDIRKELQGNLEIMQHVEPLMAELNRDGIRMAIRTGDLLMAAHKKVNKHGEWLPWIKSNCLGVTVKTCQNYMRFALWAEANAKHVSQLESLREGYIMAGIIKLPKVKKCERHKEEEDEDDQESQEDPEGEDEDSKEAKAEQDQMVKLHKTSDKLVTGLSALSLDKAREVLDTIRPIVDWYHSIEDIIAKQEANEKRMEESLEELPVPRLPKLLKQREMVAA